MAPLIQRIGRQALATFVAGDTAAFPSNFERLKTLLDSVTAEDIKLVLPEKSNGSYSRAPATHVSIFECPIFTLAVFILKKGCSIPLHDHPGMFGLCKVVHGQISVESYDIQSETILNGKMEGLSRNPIRSQLKRRLIRCKKTEQTFNEDSGSCVLTPTSGNHHTIHNTSTGPSAFVDILAPPYAQEQGRDCTYFKECDPSAVTQNPGIQLDGTDSWILEIPAPREFYCDTQPYSGPLVNLQVISELSET